MINLQWGTQKNGQIDTTLLVDVSGREDYLEPTAAAQWKRMVAACKAATGATLAPASGSSAYRPISTQQKFYAQRAAYLANKGPFFPTAAYPGTSNHGWARAIDITGHEGGTRWRSPRTGNTYSVNLTVWNWLLAHAAEYGYDWATGDGSDESWHWESLTPPGTAVSRLSATLIPNPQTQEDVMAIVQVTDVNPNPIYLVAPGHIAHIPNAAALAVAKANFATFDGVHNVSTAEFNVTLALLRIPVEQAYHFGGHPAGYSWSRVDDIAKKVGV